MIAWAEFINCSSIAEMFSPNCRLVGALGISRSPGVTGIRPAARVNAIFLSSTSRAFGRKTSGPAR
jgi:hypothetical protein